MTILSRSILTLADLENFKESTAYSEIVGFLTELNCSVQGLSLLDQTPESPSMQALQQVMSTIKGKIDEIPPYPEGKSRFGNPAFQEWYDFLQSSLAELLGPLIPSPYLAQVSTYFGHSFGNRKRIDYGTGHELHFIVFLLCLKKINVITQTDYPCVVLKVFWQYIMVMRHLQQVYWLEPAGSFQ
jgi:serine/threonine-protein phosphatase 2A activator